MPSDKNTRRQRHQAQVKTQPGKAVRGAQSTEFVKKAGYRKSEFIGGKKYYTPMSTDPTSSGAGGDVTNITISGSGGGSIQGAVLADGTVPFNSTQVGISPTETAHIATKGYVDDQIATKDTLGELGDVSYSGSPQTGQSLKWSGSAWQNQTTATGISSVTGYDVSSDGYGSAVSGNTGLKFNDDYDTGASTGIYFEVTDSGNDTIVTPNIVGALTDNNDNTTYSTSWVDSSANAILRLTAGGSGSGNDDLTIVAGGNITLTPSGDNLTIAANNTTSYSLVNSTGNPGDAQTLVMTSTGTEGRVRAIKPGDNITMSLTETDSDTSYVTVNASLSGATIDSSEVNPLGGYFTWNTSNLRFIDNGRISWELGRPSGTITTVTPTITNPSAADVGAIATGHAANNITSSHITVLGNTSGTNSGDVCSSNHTGAGYLTSNQTITLSGDCSGSGTTSIAVTVADDSHNHTIANVDNLQTSLDAKAALAGATFTGDVEVENSKIYFDGTWASGSERYLRGDGASGSKYIRWHWNNNNPAGTNIHDNHSVAIVVDGNNCVFDDNGHVKAAGDVWAYTSSDPSLKTNKQLIENPLDKLASIGGYSYDWKREAVEYGDHLKGHDYGVMADEIERILPELVVTRDSGTKAVKYEKIIPLLIEAVKELSKKVDNGLE
tara:strand:+ start:1310 stop:3307 length:1998 start_codon:yes stop_codon:yes gene_type:complete